MAQSNPPSTDVRSYLISNSVGVADTGTDWAVFIGSEPDKPNRCITIYDTPGPPPNPKFLLDEPRFQVRVRSHDYKESFDKAEEIKGWLIGLPNVTINDTLYVGIWVVIDTSFLRLGEENKFVHVTTYRSIREPNTGQHRQPL